MYEPTTLDFLNRKVETRDSIVTDSINNRKKLDMNRLLDTNDDYDEILVNSQRCIVYEDGEYKLGIPRK